jgi:hypothetical protein
VRALHAAFGLEQRDAVVETPAGLRPAFGAAS